MHIDEFLNQHSTALSSSNIATYNNAWLSSDNTNTQDQIERLTYHLAVIFPQISRDVIRSTLHSCQLDVEGTVTRLANPSPPAAAAASTSSTSTTSNATRGLSRWRPGSNKNTGKKPPVTVSPVVNKLEPEDESAQLDVALCQLTSIFPDHDMDALVEALMQCHLKVDAAINHVLANNKSNKKTSKPTSWKNTPKANSTKQQQQQQHLPEPIQSPRAQKMTQQQRDFWTAHRYQRKANEEGKEVATRSTSAKNTVNTSVSLTVGSNTSQYDRILESKLEYHNDDDQHQHYPTTIGGDDPDVCAQYALSFYEKRNEAFKRAAQAFRARNRNGAFGAALASFYASEGRDYNESMRRWNTRAAIGVLRSFQKQWIKDYVVDLHYMTVDQALEVALLAVQDWSVIEKKVMVSTGKSTPRPLRIVTGAGSHSHDGRAKLFPRVQRALREAGWQVTAVDKGSFMVTSIQSTSNHY
ncbi:hypothetical protein BDF22DRAFT_678057 [Syncephalis plumigaleata]|nr:hypothetical protein BDF22DRAFT_678057 [Syncephalis plumigaleata]